MISYDPIRWRDHFFDLRGSMLREILYRVGFCVLVSIAAVGLDSRGVHLHLSDRPHLLIGPALFLLLVFRTNAANERYWEGRRAWGQIVNSGRNLVRKASALLGTRPALVDGIAEWTIAFCWATRDHLRGERGLGPSPALPPDELAAALAAPHVALAAAARATALILAGQREGLLSDIQQVALDADAQALIDHLGACERIRSTPLPYAYVVHLRRALLIYCTTLPFTLLATFGAYTPIITLLVAYVLMGIEEIGVEIESPFGDAHNDLPLDNICAGIEATLRGQPR